MLCNSPWSQARYIASSTGHSTMLLEFLLHDIGMHAVSCLVNWLLYPEFHDMPFSTGKGLTMIVVGRMYVTFQASDSALN